MLEETRSWPFVEARKILSKINNKTPDKGYVLFETGYGPSGLPHIGTFGEVARTTMVRHAFETISDIPTKLVAFSDDMDALRKVPTNVPNQKMLEQYIGMPLTKVPDPFEKYESFAHHLGQWHVAMDGGSWLFVRCQARWLRCTIWLHRMILT